MRRWLHDWYITLKYGSVFTKAGRELRRTLKDTDPDNWVEVDRPGSFGGEQGVDWHIAYPSDTDGLGFKHLGPVTECAEPECTFLFGPPGTPKSQLARRVAWRWRLRHPFKRRVSRLPSVEAMDPASIFGPPDFDE